MTALTELDEAIGWVFELAEERDEGALWAAAECGVIEPDCPPEQWLTPGDNPYLEGTEI